MVWKTIAIAVVVILMVIMAQRNSDHRTHPDDIKPSKVVKSLLDRYPTVLRKVTGWAKDGDWKSMESEHDYIQVLFPLTEPGVANKNLTLRSKRDVSFLARNESFRKQYEQALLAMCKFYGIGVAKPKVPGGSQADFLEPHFEIVQEERFRKFFVQSGHNHKRITRIIKFLGLMRSRFYVGFKEFALEQANENSLSEVTIEFWEQA